MAVYLYQSTEAPHFGYFMFTGNFLYTLSQVVFDVSNRSNYLLLYHLNLNGALSAIYNKLFCHSGFLDISYVEHYLYLPFNIYSINSATNHRFKSIAWVTIFLFIFHHKGLISCVVIKNSA